MFTGIIEAIGVVREVRNDRTNVSFSIESPLSHEFRADQSVSHNGVCLTVTKTEGARHFVTAIQETLNKSNLGKLQPGDTVNLERCMLNNGRFDGHIVQGHVDTTGHCTSVKDENGSWLFEFSHAEGPDYLTVEKGSICVNGTSLTCFNVRPNGFSVAIIPYTFEHTNFGKIQKGDTVNLEFDILGKYIRRLLKP